MAKEKQTRRLIAMALAASVATSAMPVTAFAEGEGGESSSTTKTETSTDSEGNKTTTTTTTNSDGSSKVESKTENTDGSSSQSTTTTNADGSSSTESSTTSADGNTVSKTTGTDDGAGNTSSTTTTTTNNGGSTVVDVKIEEGWNNTVDNLAGNDTEGDGEGTDTPAEGGSSDGTIADVNGNGVIDDLDKFVAEHNPGTTNTDTTNTTGSETETQYTETKNNKDNDPLENSGSTNGSETETQNQTTVEKTTETVYEFEKDWEQTVNGANPESDKDEDYTDDTDYTEGSSSGPETTTPVIDGGSTYVDAADGDLTVTLDGSQATDRVVGEGDDQETVKAVEGNTDNEAAADAAYAALVNTVKAGLTQKLATELGVDGTPSGENVTFEKTEYVNVGTPAEGETQKQDKVVTKVTLQPIKDAVTGEVTGFETVKEVYTIPYNYYTAETPGDIVEDTDKQTTTVENGTLLLDSNGNPVLDAETGRPIMLVPVIDAEGNPVLDPVTNEPLMQEQVAPTTVNVTGGNPVVKLPDLKLPEEGETVDEATGDKTTVTVDPETGDKTYVTEEAATGYKRIMTVEPKYAEDGVTQIGWIKNTVIQNKDGKEIGGGQETVLGTVTYTETRKEVEQATTVDKFGAQIVETTKQIDKVVTTETINITATERQMWAEMLLRLGEGHGDMTLPQFINPDENKYGNLNETQEKAMDLRPGDWQWMEFEDGELKHTTVPEGKLLFTGYGMWSDLMVSDQLAVYDANGNITGYVNNPATDHNTHLFELTDSTGKTFYGYCAELGKGIERGAYYSIENLNTADWYTFEKNNAKDNIMAIAVNGYWGTSSGMGSLTDVKAKLQAAYDTANGNFPMTQAQINNLTEGQALAATQAAIWQYGNANDSGLRIDQNQIIGSYWGGSGSVDVYTIFNAAQQTNNWAKNVAKEADEDRAAAQAMFNYLINIVGENGTYTPPTGFEETNVFDTEDIVASITAKDKVAGLDVNNDDDDTNDVYNTDVSFTLAITPDYTKGDNYDVHVFDQNGNKVKTVSLQNFGTENGTSKDGNTYTMSMELAEGVNVTLNIDGVQNLNNSVYLYTSEPINTTDHSQTFVGLAGGQREVNLNMDLKFTVTEPTVTATGSRSSRNHSKTVSDQYTNEYHAQEGNVVALVEVTKETVTTTSREWNEEYEETWSYGGNNNNDPQTPTTPEETKTTTTDPSDPGDVLGDEEELMDIGDDGTPLGDKELEDPMLLGDEEIIAATGDSNHMTGAFGGMFAALAGMFLLRKKKEN